MINCSVFSFVHFLSFCFILSAELIFFLPIFFTIHIIILIYLRWIYSWRGCPPLCIFSVCGMLSRRLCANMTTIWNHWNEINLNGNRGEKNENEMQKKNGLKVFISFLLLLWFFIIGRRDRTVENITTLFIWSNNKKCNSIHITWFMLQSTHAKEGEEKN